MSAQSIAIVSLVCGVLGGGMLACALPRKWVPVKHKRWISLVLMVIFGLVIASPGARLTGLAWFGVFTGAHLMFTDEQKWRPIGKAVLVLGFVLVFSDSAMRSAKHQEQQRQAMTRQ
jgi:hypothetical protein